MKLIQFIRFVKTIIRILFGRGAVWLLFPTLASCQIGFFSAGAPKLLDEYSGASAAFSVHQLSNAATLAMQVRRASDNATADIGFDNGELNIGQLINHCSGTNCFVSVWYDQSGNGRNATQTTAASQPKIYDSSTGIIYENGKPALKFDATNDFLTFLTPSGLLGNDPKTIIAVYRGLSDTLQYQFQTGTRINFGGVNNSLKGYNFDTSSANNIRYYHTGRGIYTGGYNESQKQYLSIFFGNTNGTSPEIYTNGNLKFSSNTLSDLDATYIELSNGYTGIGTFNAAPINANYQTVIFYASNQTANRTGIETNLNNFFSIY